MSILISILVLGSIGAIGAIVLFAAAKKFSVYEDPRISEIEALLPGANCGGCGRKGCRDFAAQSVKAGSLEGLFCPVAGNDGMKAIADALGCAPTSALANVAVVKCAGTPLTKSHFDASYAGPQSCTIMNTTADIYQCANSCLGCGDCVNACPGDAITISPENGYPTIDGDTCTGCGSCVKACPRQLIILRPKGPRGRRVWVACSNCQKGAITRRQCSVGCIGCGLCAKTCKFQAITIANNLAYIDPDKCKACGMCVSVCPTHAIHCANIKIVSKNESKDI